MSIKSHHRAIHTENIGSHSILNDYIVLFKMLESILTIIVNFGINTILL